MRITTVLFRFQGRINRRDYWLKGMLPTLLIFLSTNTLALLIQNNIASEPEDLPLRLLTAVVFGFLCTYIYLAISAKRWHDIGKSAWWNMWLFVPIVGALIIIPLTIVLGVLPGKKEDNKHGATLRKP